MRSKEPYGYAYVSVEKLQPFWEPTSEKEITNHVAAFKWNTGVSG
jgi:hypothetical protein